jgi:hypothetical protein
MDRSRLILRVVLHIAPWEVGGRKGAPREVPRRGTRREVSRIAARGEATRIAGHRDLTRSREAAGRSQPLEPDNLAHKMKGELQLFRQIRRCWQTYSWNYARKSGSLLAYQRIPNRRFS